MAFTQNPNMLWNDKPLSNCSHDELVEAVTLLLKERRRVRRTKSKENSPIDFSEMGLK